MKKSSDDYPKSLIIKLMFRMLLPNSKVVVPVLLLFYFAAFSLTLFSVYIWIKNGLADVPLQSVLTLWFLVLFSNFWEAWFAWQKQKNDQDESNETD